jgi:SAM-dependent methyltransferase
MANSFIKFFNKIFKSFKKLPKLFIKMPLIQKLLILLIIAFVITSYMFNKKEGFEQASEFMVKKGNDVYDDFYCSIYDDLVYDDLKNDYEVVHLKRSGGIDNNSTVVDLGCGRGHHVNYYTEKGIKTTGLDISPSMINLAKQEYPKSDFKVGDMLDSSNFQYGSTSHIICLYFTIYSVEDKAKFFKNCFHWLKPGGKLIVHLVNRDKFDPILNAANPLSLVNAQKYAKSRLTKSVVKFKDFLYKASFVTDSKNDMAYFYETFKDDSTKNTRKNEHMLYMESQRDILTKAKNTGFIMHSKIDMVGCQYEYQYLYFLQKPE